jgi:predicted nucleotide-binding protein
MEAASKLLENFCESKSPRLGSTRSPGGRSRVFLVHGHDTGALSTVARFLERLGLDVVVLHEQPNSGRTIIEKFIDYSDVEYAVVLLTPDDRGGLASDRYEQQRSRARQNVVFELGYFVGKLGRDRVCALYECTVEVPSDYSGVVFVPLDAQAGWRTALASELRAAGVNIQIDRILA